MTTLFATNKTFNVSGTTSDTLEGYKSVMGFQLVRRKNAIGGGSHFAVAMFTISTEYTDEKVDRAIEKVAKAEAKAEATARALKINAHFDALIAA